MVIDFLVVGVLPFWFVNRRELWGRGWYGIITATGPVCDVAHWKGTTVQHTCPESHWIAPLDGLGALPLLGSSSQHAGPIFQSLQEIVADLIIEGT